MKVAFITGGSRGIGFGIAKALLNDGWAISITGRSAVGVAQAVEQLNTSGRDPVLGLTCDVRQMAEQERAVAQTLERFGRIDLLVANAGIGHFSPIETMDVTHWQETIDTNLTGVFFSVKACLQALMQTKGYIITISSLAGTNFFATASAYNASKFGLTGFTQAIMLDLRRHGIRVSTIMPGSVATDFNGNKHDKDEAWKIQIEDIGQMVSDLMRLNPRTLPSKIEVRPSSPG